MEVEECGIHEIWLLHELPYAEYIFKTKDLMHSANNIIKDSIRLFQPSNYHTSRENRTKQERVIKDCESLKIFKFMTTQPASFPWILSNREADIHDKRLLSVVGKCSEYHSLKIHR